MYPKNITTILIVLGLMSGALHAQQSLLQLAEPDIVSLVKEDDRSGTTRFSAPLSLDIAPAAEPDTYSFENGEWTWSQTFSVPNATGLALFADHLNLPEGGHLTLENEHGSQGPFTQADASRKARLFTDFLPGDKVTLTYRGPLPETTPFHLWRMDHVYRPDRWKNPFDKDFGDANSCHVNANCAEGDGWDDEKSGTGRINLVVAEGVGFCSGNLINNTAQDGRPYLLTGFHCMDGFTPLYDLWSVDFGYTSQDCNNPTEEPVPTKYIGVEFRAGLQATDFMLLEIMDEDFTAADHYFAGWDRSAGGVSGLITHFHHPFGDIQKIGVSDAQGMPILNNQITWNSGVVTPPRHHFTMDYATGTFEVGSSGSCYFDEDHRIRGTLNGGNSNCPGNSEAFVGRFHLSWDTGTADSTRLQSWLDPLGTNPMTLDGENLLTKRFVKGTVSLAGAPAAGVDITYQWATGSVTYTTDADGRYYGERPAEEATFAISGVYAEDGSLTNGVDVGDLISIRRDILGLDTLSPAERLASDSNNSGTTRVSDITHITRVILEVDDWRGRPNWLVMPFGFPIDPTPVNPETPIGISLNNRAVQEVEVNFYLLKTGDANGSAGNE
ncbi:hypothetical protein FUA23_02590 [Neolewinella aurantiaca]|uniref:Lysyl endopeptidase n=1 Tax=Neolewinella aurantiaca TaxID=2602767 RepID=A0A5C7G0E2_9BACT|nr:hypothetical protein [Neolewinella aurantiaca]TXF91135.1 hypothetical protein FUA23_02590 [Neolewinella aurantiaca]